MHGHAAGAGAAVSTPFFSQRRPEVVTHWRRHSGLLTRLSRLQSAMSSISAIAGKPPTVWNASRRTNIAWSPVAIPVSRERTLMNQAMTGNNGERPSILTSKRPHARRD